MGTSTPIFPQVISTPVLMYHDSNATQTLPFWTGSANGDKLEALSMCSTDTNATVMNLIFQVGGINYQLGTVAVPGNSGTDGAVTTAVNALQSGAMTSWVRTDSNGRAYMYIGPNVTLAMGLQSGLTHLKQISIMGQIGSY
jgi:hypothetical protein